MAPSTNTTRPRTGSLSLSNNHSNNHSSSSALDNYYTSKNGNGGGSSNVVRGCGGGGGGNNPTVVRGMGGENQNPQKNNHHTAAQQKYYQSLTRGGQRKHAMTRSSLSSTSSLSSNKMTTTTGIERSYNSITSTLKGRIASFDASLDSRGDSCSRSSGSGRSSMESYSVRRGGYQQQQPQQSQQRSMDTTPMTSNRRTITTTTDTSSSSTLSGGTLTFQEGGVRSVPSFAPSLATTREEYEEEQGMERGCNNIGHVAVETVPSFASSSAASLESSYYSSRRASLREIKAALREEKRRSNIIAPMALVEEDESREGLGMESVPSFASSKEDTTASLRVGGNNRGGISMASSGSSIRMSRNTNNSSSLRRCQLEEMLGNDKSVAQLRTGEGAAAGKGGNNDERMRMIANQRSRESLDTFRTETSFNTTNMDPTTKSGSAGLYSANLQKKKERESLDTLKKTSQAVCKMSQASFGKIRDILAGEGHHQGGGQASAQNRTSIIGGYRESGIGLGGILHFGRTDSADEEMSFFVSGNDGKVHKEKVPLVNVEVKDAFVNEGAMVAADALGGQKQKKKKVVVLDQETNHLGETMKTTNVSRGVEKSRVSFQQQQQQQQQQQRSLFHVKKGENKIMSTAPQSPIPASGNTPPIVRSVKKATRAVSHSMKHEVVPATKAMAALTVKLVERGEKKMKDGVAPKLRAVALDIDSRLNHHHQQRPQNENGEGGGFVGLKHIEGKGDYVFDPNYRVTLTPQNIDQAGRRTYGPNPVHNFDHNTPACLLGAVTAGTMFNYDITHPEHPEYLPEGIPRVLEVPLDWEERAGFVPAAALAERMGSQPVDLDDAVEESEGDENERVEEMLAMQQVMAMSYDANETAAKEEVEEEVTDEEDARNASMWVAYNPEEDMEEEDEVMNLGEIIVATGGEFGGDDNEFSPRSMETGDSNTYHVGDFSVGVESDEGEVQKQSANVTFHREQHLPVETFEDDTCNESESENDANDIHPAKENYEETPMKKVTYADGEVPSQQQQFTDKKKEFQTPFSVKKGERPMTFEEFRAMNSRVLFDNEEQEPELQEIKEVKTLHAIPSQAVANANIGRNTEMHEQPEREITVENFVSGAVPSSMYDPSGHGQRELKGRVVMIRIKKKISKAVKNALKQLLLTAKVGGKKKSSNKPIVGTNFIITIPRPDPSVVPDSPSAMSIASSLLSAAISESSKRVIGAAPFSSNANAIPDYLYGAVNYHNRGFDDGSCDESEQLPPPPKMKSNYASEHDDDDVVSFLAEAMNHGLIVDEVLEIEDGQENVEEEEQMYLVLTPSEGGVEKVAQVISGNVEGTPVVFNEIMHKNEDGSEIKPHNLSTMFDSGKKAASKNSFQIMDSVRAGGNIILSPSESNQNVGSVFRRSSAGEANASILQSSTFDSEDETLVTHDGNTLVRSDTRDTHDHTIATTTSLKEEEKKAASTFKMSRDNGTSPALPAYSHQAASNASFLFSPDNMGRANPRIRAKERALMRNQSHEGSITMLPSAPSMDKSERRLSLKPKPSYSFDYSAGGEAKYGSGPSSSASEASVEEASDEPDTPSTAATAVQKKPVMASMTKDRQFSFKTILKQFSTDPLDSKDRIPRAVEQRTFASPGVAFSSGESQSKTPVVTNAVRKKYPATPFRAANSPPSSSPSNSSIASFKSGGRRKSSPREKALPKSAAKTRTGLVKDRISMFQQRVDMRSAVTGVNGRLKKNHSYRLKNQRRETHGGGVLAPRKAVLQSSAFIRTVPIGISTSYSRDEATVEETPDKADDAGVKRPNTQNESYNDDDDTVDEPNSYVKQYINTAKVDENAESFGRSSLDTSSCVSEATECDAFNSLLGQCVDDDSSVESESSEETKVRQKHNENVSVSPNVLPSTFKTATLVKPNEINHNRTPLTPMKWRSMAAIHGKSSSKTLGTKK